MWRLFLDEFGIKESNYQLLIEWDNEFKNDGPLGKLHRMDSFGMQLLAEVHAADGEIAHTELVERVDPDAEEQIGERIDDLAQDDWIQVRGGVVTLTEWAEAPAKSFHDQIAEFRDNPLSG